MLERWNGLLIDLDDISYVTDIKMEHSDSFLFVIVFKAGHELNIANDTEEPLKEKLNSLNEKVAILQIVKERS